MYVPGVTEPSAQRLYRRKGGGGGGKGGGGKSGSSGRSGSSSSSGNNRNSGSKSSSGSSGSTGSVGTRGSTVPVSGATNGRTTAVAYGSGTTKVVTIPQGQPFAGRTSGGATRGSVYGNRCVCSDDIRMWRTVLTRGRCSYYGSGYPGTPGLGVVGRGFPFVFWPLVWGGGLGYGAAYLHDSSEVGPQRMSNIASSQRASGSFHPKPTLLITITPVAVRRT